MKMMIFPFALMVLFLSGCRLLEFLESAGRKLDPVGEMTSQGSRLVEGKKPVISAGDYRDKSIWNDPHVIRVSDRYVMYMTSSIGEPFKPPVLPFRAVSQDGVNWRLEPKEPLLDVKGSPFVSMETPSVVRFKGKYHMFYTGIYPEGTVPPMAIGHAVSDDGISWINDKSPLLEATGNFQDWNGYLVGEPGAVVYRDKVFLYFSAVGARPSGQPPQLQSIGLVTMSDGSNYGRPHKVLEQSALYPASKGFVGYSTPAAFVLENKIHLVFDVAHFSRFSNPQWRQVAIHHAVAMKEGTGFVQDGEPLLTKNDLDWTSGEILAPAVLVDGKQIKIWFAGHVSLDQLGRLAERGWKGKEFGIGYFSVDVNSFLGAAQQ